MALGEKNAVYQIDVEDAGNNGIVAALMDSGWRWRDSKISYAFDGWGDGTKEDGKAVAMMFGAMLAWGNVANLSFDPVLKKHSKADLLLHETADEDLDFYGWAATPFMVQRKREFDNDLPQSDVGRSHVHFAFDNGWFEETRAGSGAYEIFLHELGHALGLKHPHDQGPGDFYQYFPGVGLDEPHVLGDNRLNQGVNTVMSYNNNYDPSAADVDYGGFIRGPMAFDIAAIQTLYGANRNFNAESTTYRLFDSSGPAKEMGWQCIWDTGGLNDSITYSGNANVVIDLRPATLQNEVGGGGRMSYTWVAGDGGARVKTSQGYTIAADYTNILKDANGVTGVLIESAWGSNGTDELTGNDANNRLYGGANNDVLRGHAGDDKLDGGTGLDQMFGGLGNDTYFIDHLGDTVYEGAEGGGVDEIRTVLGSYILGRADDSRVENLTYTGTAGFFGVGNALDNVITGGAGADLLEGGDGNDTLVGNGSADTLRGGKGDDVYRADSTDTVAELADQGIDRIETYSAEFTLGNNIENLDFVEGERNRPRTGIGNGLDNNISGSSVEDVLSGRAGNDIIFGDKGADKLFGEAGNDTLQGGLGDDSLDGGTGIDVAYYGDLTGRTVVDLSAGTAKIDGPQGKETDSLRNIERVVAGLGDDKVIGDDNDNTIYFSGEHIRGRSSGGRDDYDGGEGSDTVSFENFSGYLFVDLAAGEAKASRWISDASNLRLIADITRIENVVASTRNDKITGDGKDNTFTYIGSFLKDNETGGYDVYEGGEGVDTIDMSRFDNGCYVNINAQNLSASYSWQTPNGGGFSSQLLAHLSDIQNGTGSLFNDTLDGNDGDNLLKGLAGNDRIFGRGGNDRLTGGEGQDTFEFGTIDFGHDVITDFQVVTDGNALHDILRFRNGVLADWAAAEAAMTDGAAGAVIIVNENYSITFAGVSRSELVANHESNFTFA